MKSILTAAVAALALAAAPVAHAQATCADINRILAESDIDFDDVIGDEIDDDIYNATYKLAGASGCEVDLSFDSVYVCFWQFASADAAVRFVDAQLGTMRGCLRAGAWEESALGPNDPTNKWRLLKGVKFDGSGIFSDLVLEARADTRVEDGRDIFEAEVSLAYLLF